MCDNHVIFIIGGLRFTLCLLQVVHLLAHLVLEFLTIQNFGSLDVRGLEVPFK